MQPYFSLVCLPAAQRIRRVLSRWYSSLAADIYIANLEIHAGRTLAKALEHFGDHLGREEVRAFAALIQPSDEIGASISKALRVRSDDMGHKRMARAEEKAYSVPAKLVMD
jgi:tight adherence protein C